MQLKNLDIPGPFHTWFEADERLCQLIVGQASEAEQLVQPEIVHRWEQWTIFLFRIYDKRIPPLKKSLLFYKVFKGGMSYLFFLNVLQVLYSSRDHLKHKWTGQKKLRSDVSQHFMPNMDIFPVDFLSNFTFLNFLTKLQKNLQHNFIKWGRGKGGMGQWLFIKFIKQKTRFFFEEGFPQESLS